MVGGVFEREDAELFDRYVGVVFSMVEAWVGASY